MSGPLREACEVLGHQRAGEYHILRLAAPAIAEIARPGQFVGVLPGYQRSFLLRRPFSIHHALHSGPGMGTVDLVINLVGAGTSALSAVGVNDTLDLLGPLGRPYPLPRDPVNCLLVGFGYRAAPLFFLAEELRRRGCRVDFALGAPRQDLLFKPMEAKRMGATLTVVTDDGSLGQSAPLAEALPSAIARGHSQVVYASAPTPMLAAIRRVAVAAGLPCQVDIEERMGCGTGMCYSCVVPLLAEEADAASERRGGGGDKEPPPPRMVRSCVDGPVFDARQVDWVRLGLGAQAGIEAASAAAAQAQSGPLGEGAAAAAHSGSPEAGIALSKTSVVGRAGRTEAAASTAADRGTNEETDQGDKTDKDRRLESMTPPSPQASQGRLRKQGS